MAGKSFFGRIMGRNQSETQAAVPMSQVNSAPQDDKTYEFNTRLGVALQTSCEKFSYNLQKRNGA